VTNKSKTFKLHFDLLVAESERFAAELKSNFKKAADNAIEIEDEDPELFGFFVEYMYRDCSILSRKVLHYSDFVTLARLYAMADRLMALKFKARCLWRFTRLYNSDTSISDESICELLYIACKEIMERVTEDPMRSQIFWYAANKIKNLRKSDMFRQLLRDESTVGQQICLYIDVPQPRIPDTPDESQRKFEPESEYTMKKAN
jgi:hypothetical protein